MSLLDIQKLSIRIGNRQICHNLDFELLSGQRWGMIGGNGVGKTTLLQTMAGLLPFEQGSIAIDNISIHDWKRRQLARRLGVLFQDSQDTFPVSVMEMVLSGRHPYLPFWAFEGKHDVEIADQALSDVSMADMADRQVNTLSGGERRRLAIATLLVQNPSIWLLDEPTNHLDLHHQISLLELLLKRVDSVNGGLLMVLHDVNLVTRFCTHAMLMVNEDSILCGPAEEIVTLENLQELYRHPIKQIQANGTRFFYPE